MIANLVKCCTIFMACFVLLGCASLQKDAVVANNDANIVYSTDSIQVRKFGESEKMTFTSSEWIELTEEDIYGFSDIIFEGSIINAQECVIDNFDTGAKSYFTSFDVTIDNILYSNDANRVAGDVVKLYYPVTSIDADYSATCPTVGTKAIFFASTIKDDGGIKFSQFVDYAIKDLNRTNINLVNDQYMIPSVFASILPESTTYSSQSSENFVPVDKAAAVASIVQSANTYKVVEKE